MTDPIAWLDQAEAGAVANPVPAAWSDLPRATSALRAVLKLHRQVAHGTTGTTTWPGVCDHCRDTYPCPTVTAITTALTQEDA